MKFLEFGTDYLCPDLFAVGASESIVLDNNPLARSTSVLDQVDILFKVRNELFPCRVVDDGEWRYVIDAALVKNPLVGGIWQIVGAPVLRLNLHIEYVEAPPAILAIGF